MNGNLNHSLYFTDQGWAGGEIFAYWNDWVSQFLIDNACFFLASAGSMEFVTMKCGSSRTTAAVRSASG